MRNNTDIVGTKPGTHTMDLTVGVKEVLATSVGVIGNGMKAASGPGFSVWPNPFRTSVDIFVRHPSHVVCHEVRLEVFDIAGKMVANIKSRATSDERRATNYTWHAQDHTAGVYIVKLKTDTREFTKNITLVK
jgi:hypothetical protein